MPRLPAHKSTEGNVCRQFRKAIRHDGTEDNGALHWCDRVDRGDRRKIGLAMMTFQLTKHQLPIHACSTIMYSFC